MTAVTSRARGDCATSSMALISSVVSSRRQAVFWSGVLPIAAAHCEKKLTTGAMIRLDFDSRSRSIAARWFSVRSPSTQAMIRSGP